MKGSQKKPFLSIQRMMQPRFIRRLVRVTRASNMLLLNGYNQLSISSCNYMMHTKKIRIVYITGSGDTQSYVSSKVELVTDSKIPEGS